MSIIYGLLCGVTKKGGPLNRGHWRATMLLDFPAGHPHILLITEIL